MARSMTRLTLFVVGLWLALVTVTEAQILTGNIIGTVRDESDAVLPGVTVTLTSPALPAGPSTTITNERGEYRFTQLSPGAYALTVALAGFSTYEEQGLRVVVGGTIERTVTLKVSSVAETITVSGQSPMVDPHKVGVTANITQEVVETLPVWRTSIQNYLKWSGPGVSPSNPSGVGSAVSVMGSATNENSVMYDGIMSNHANGGNWLQGDVDAVAEIQVVSLGASAEYQVAQGAVFIMTTKQGTNVWKFDAQGHWYPDGLLSKPFKLPCNCPLGQTGYAVQKAQEYSGHGGGPIIKDRLWFFGGGMYISRRESNPGIDPERPRVRYEHTAIGKITWQVNDRVKLSQMYENEWWNAPPLPSIQQPYETVTEWGNDVLPVYASEANITISNNTLLTVRATGFYNPQDRIWPLTGDIVTAYRVDQITGIACCGVQSFGWSNLGRHGQAVKLNRFIQGSRSDHDLRVGVQFERANAHDETATPSGVQYSDLGGAPDQATFRPPSARGASYSSQGVWAEDQMRIADILMLSVGTRFDRMHAVSQDLPAIDTLGQYTGQTIQGLGDMFTWNVWAPRVGFNLKLTDDGRMTLRGNYGRAYRTISTNDFWDLHPGVATSTLARFDPVTQRYSTIISVTDPRANIDIDRHLDAPSTDQYSIGVDRELMPSLGVSATYVYKRGRNQVGWTDAGGVYGTQTVALPDGRPLTVFPLLNPPSARRFVTTNGPGLFNRYRGLVLSLDKRFSQRWRANVSYTYSKSEGLVTSGTAGRDPNDLINATGRLSLDRPHIFVASGSYEIPRIDLQVAANLMALSGTPYAPQALISLPQGRRAINIKPPDGTYRVPSQELLYLQFTKMLFRQADRRVELTAELANALQNQAYLNVVTRNFFAPNFGQSAGDYIYPRRLNFIAKVFF